MRSEASTSNACSTAHARLYTVRSTFSISPKDPRTRGAARPRLPRSRVIRNQFPSWVVKPLVKIRRNRVSGVRIRCHSRHWKVFSWLDRGVWLSQYAK